MCGRGRGEGGRGRRGSGGRGVKGGVIVMLMYIHSSKKCTIIILCVILNVNYTIGIVLGYRNVRTLDP